MSGPAGTSGCMQWFEVPGGRCPHCLCVCVGGGGGGSDLIERLGTER